MVKRVADAMVQLHGVTHNMHLQSSKDKVKATNMKNRGVEHSFQSKEVREKAKRTCIENNGTEYPMQSKDVQAKSRLRNLKNRGVEYPMQSKDVQTKSRNTCMKHYGVPFNTQSSIIKERSANTSLIRYGVRHPSQNQEIMERAQKNAKKIKEFRMPSGDIRKVQGYEPLALNRLVNDYTEDQIKTGCGNVPRIQYTVGGKKRYHFPDIWIPHENKIIEVKSTWTVKCKKDSVFIKKNAAEQQGFVYEIWCFDKKGNRVEVNASELV
jgi:hypothetical protein